MVGTKVICPAAVEPFGTGGAGIGLGDDAPSGLNGTDGVGIIVPGWMFSGGDLMVSNLGSMVSTGVSIRTG